MILISGPCVLETYDKAKEDLKLLLRYTKDLEFYFKASCAKMNRTKISNYRGLGLKYGSTLMLMLKEKYGCMITTDFHSVEDLKKYGSLFDLIQIPAFLAAQNDLLEAAASLGKPINVKKPQFYTALDTLLIVQKLVDLKVERFFITDRGTFTGGKNLYMDTRIIDTIKSMYVKNIKILVDTTHPNKDFSYSANNVSLTRNLGKAYLINKADGVFMEMTTNPISAQCDKDTQIDSLFVGDLIKEFYKVWKFANDRD